MADSAADIDAHPHEGGGAAQTAKDLFSGAAGGVAQVLLGQPFDIVKVRLQTATTPTTALSAATSIWRNEGPLAFYKGTLTPLLGIGACVSVQFGGFHAARRWFEDRNTTTHGSPPAAPLSYPQYYAAGAFAGVANSVISGPIEHVRIRLQTQPHGAARLYSGPLDCVRKLVAAPGGGLWRGVYRGEAVTILREAQAYGVWFLAFEWLMNADARRNRVSRDDIPAYKIAFYGGLAGEALWLASYPLDVVKSKMQTDGFGAEMRYRSMRDCFAQTWAKEGMGGFWRGLGPTLLRAMPVSAGTFAVVEMTRRAIN
ncbi:mitochondrial carrier [Cryphonectria parasitica EP155]|uniref:Mitochondrial carrier n=1 Tax=Cryphonectria parasitica (strain ATCC 38755 / EP155) TaxID=660469 RepID=A0A9P5CLT2_CRYP1|nr:mitochondrial carrier [Cryphonectria parasitica EP155]KAF3763654.1 mitochondrial carrier [Cryphonectria parasitica EP155]